jgi:site-specific DNA-cytosine methylase
MNVLSLFDGMSCGRVALERCGFTIDKYYASEIDKYAITVAANNYLDTIHVGDVTQLRAEDLDPIDLLIGGSPCQGFSFAGKQLNFEDPRSKLFFEFVRLVKECTPKYFFLENVVMKKEFQDVISSYLGVQPIMLNSSLVSAQSRKRLYWTNIPGYTPPEDKGILLKDIVHEHCLTDRDKSHAIIGSIGRTTTREYFQKNQGQMVAQFNVNPSGKGMNGNVYPVTKLKSNCLTTNKGEGQKISVPTDINCIRIPEATKQGYAEIFEGEGVDLTFIESKTRRGRRMADKCNCLTASAYDYRILEELKSYIVPFDKTLQILDKEVARGKVGYFRKDSQANRVYYIHDKVVTLCGDAGGGAAKMGQYLFGEVKREVHQVSECKKAGGKQPRMQDRIYNVEGISPCLTQFAGRINVGIPCGSDYLFGCITPDRVDKRQNGQRFNDGTKFYTLTAQDRHGILIEGYIRKLTPIECERLQTLPDNYTLGVSNSQRYKMLGNGWTVDAVCEFFKHIPKDLELF